MKISSAFPSKYLKASDLQGREIKVTITGVEMEILAEDSADTKPVVYFIGKQKGLVLNKTNGTKIAAAYGDETDEWQNHSLILVPDTTNFQGRMVDCIRVRIPAKLDLPEEPSEF